MEKLEPPIGNNRTGVARARALCEEMLEGNQEFAPRREVDDSLIALVRHEYALEHEPIGTLPPPASMEQLGKTAKAALKPGSATIFTDKLAARLAFERSGVRLYQALLSKFDTFEDRNGSPSRVDLELILSEELEHFWLLEQAVTEMGGDPTVMTPGADLESVASEGLRAILVDPRTTLAQSLEALMIAELADSESWDTLVELARRAGESALVSSFEQAQMEEHEHVVKVRSWLAELRA